MTRVVVVEAKGPRMAVWERKTSELYDAFFLQMKLQKPSVLAISALLFTKMLTIGWRGPRVSIGENM